MVNHLRAKRVFVATGLAFHLFATSTILAAEQEPLQAPGDLLALMEKLRGADWVEREEARRELEQLAPFAVPQLIEALKSEDAFIRSTAVLLLGETRDARSIEPLIERSADDGAWPGVARALARIGPPAVERLQQLLKEADGPRKTCAISALCQMGTPTLQVVRDFIGDPAQEMAPTALAMLAERAPAFRVFDIAVAALDDDRPRMREMAAYALSRVADPRAIPHLTRAILKGTSPPGAPNVALALHAAREGVDIEQLLPALAHENPEVRLYAAFVLARAGNAQGTNALQEELKGTDLQTRHNACVALLLLEDPGPLELWLPFTNDPDVPVRASAVQALGKIGGPDAVAPLLLALGDKQWWIRMLAAWGLAETKEPRVAERLVEVLKNDIAPVRAAAAEALGGIGNELAVQSLREALHDPALLVQCCAVAALAKVDTGLLIDELKHENLLVRKFAAYELGKSRVAQGVDPLIAALKDDAPVVRATAAWALAQICDQRAVAPLISALEDLHPGVRRKSAEALGYLRDGRAVGALIGALSDRSSTVRSEAARSLGQIGGTEAIQRLRSVFHQPSSAELSTAAIEGLAQTDSLNETYQFAKALAKDDLDVREAAARALWELTGQDFGQDPKLWRDWATEALMR